MQPAALITQCTTRNLLTYQKAPLDYLSQLEASAVRCWCVCSAAAGTAAAEAAAAAMPHAVQLLLPGRTAAGMARFEQAGSSLLLLLSRCYCCTKPLLQLAG
jgi:hypothetical protein